MSKKKTRKEAIELFFLCRHGSSENLEKVAFSEFTDEQRGVSSLQLSKFHPRRSFDECFHIVWKRLGADKVPEFKVPLDPAVREAEYLAAAKRVKRPALRFLFKLYQLGQTEEREAVKISELGDRLALDDDYTTAIAEFLAGDFLVECSEHQAIRITQRGIRALEARSWLYRIRIAMARHGVLWLIALVSSIASVLSAAAAWYAVYIKATGAPPEIREVTHRPTYGNFMERIPRWQHWMIWGCSYSAQCPFYGASGLVKQAMKNLSLS